MLKTILIQKRKKKKNNCARIQKEQITKVTNKKDKGKQKKRRQNKIKLKNIIRMIAAQILYQILYLTPSHVELELPLDSYPFLFEIEHPI